MRDWEHVKLIRLILLNIVGPRRTKELDAYPPEVVNQHFDWLMESQHIEMLGSGIVLTESGRQFFDAVKDENAWEAIDEWVEKVRGGCDVRAWTVSDRDWQAEDGSTN